MEKDQIIKLPINETPMIRCYRIHAYVMNILDVSHISNWEKYVISHYLCLHNGAKKIARDYLDFHLENNYTNIVDGFRDNSWFDIIQVHDFNIEDHKNSQNIKNLIISYLEDRYYCLQNVNEACFPHTYYYGGSVFNNISMVYGYDATKDVFMMLDYDSQDRFGTSRVSFDDYFAAISSVTVRNRLNFIKANQNHCFKFDFNHSLKLLNCYLHSQNAYSDHNEYTNHIFGYESVERTLYETQNNRMNIINIRAILEHKDILLKYFRYVTNNSYIKNENFLKIYEEINEEMHIIFMKILKKMMFAGNNCNYLKESDLIRRLNEKEAELLRCYLG